MKEQTYNHGSGKKKPWRFILIAAVICISISLLGDFAAWIVFSMGGISFPVREASTIGIIGGADGPTAIFVTSSAASAWQFVLKVLLLILSILGLYHLKRRK